MKEIETSENVKFGHKNLGSTTLTKDSRPLIEWFADFRDLLFKEINDRFDRLEKKLDETNRILRLYNKSKD